MAYTFGGANSDYVAYSLAALAQNSTTLITGWWYPTSLNSGDVLWSYTISGTNTCDINTTTTQLRFRSSNASTRATYTASLDPITINAWWYFAFLVSRTTSTENIRIWQGTAIDPPREMTVTNTVVGSGTYSSTSSFNFGNVALSSLTWNGDIDSITQIFQGTNGLDGPLPLQTGGTITNDEAKYIYDKWVFPIWSGNPNLNDFSPPSTGITHILQFNFDSRVSVYGYGYRKTSTNASNGSILGTMNGPVFSQRSCPRPIRKNWNQRYERIVR